MARVACSFLALVGLIVASLPVAAHAQTAVSICGQIVSGDAYLANDLDCPPSFAASVIVEGGSLDLRGFTIRGGEVGVLCAHPIWEENTFVYKKCRVFGGAIEDFDVAGVAAKKLDLSDVALTGTGLAVVTHKSLRFANLAIDAAAENGNAGIFTLNGAVKGTNLTMLGGAQAIWAGKFDVDGMVASGSLSGVIRANAVRLRHASLTGGGAGVHGGKKATIENSIITGYAEEGVQAQRITLVASTVTGNGLDLHAQKARLFDGSTCGTSSGLGVCTAD